MIVDYQVMVTYGLFQWYEYVFVPAYKFVARLSRNGVGVLSLGHSSFYLSSTIRGPFSLFELHTVAPAGHIHTRCSRYTCHAQQSL